MKKIIITILSIFTLGNSFSQSQSAQIINGKVIDDVYIFNKQIGEHIVKVHNQSL